MLTIADKRIDLGKGTLIMGVVNVTPDSFYDGGSYLEKDRALRQAEKLAEQGADIIDIGGESSRPGAEAVDIDAELKRVIPVVEALTGRIKVPLSIDTRKSQVARQALASGASIINDVSALRADREMAGVIKAYEVPVVLMHMRGAPRDMQANPHYNDVVTEIKEFFRQRIEWAGARGIKKDNIIIDPGIGFGKLLEHNLEILKRLAEFQELGCPILIGPSRKSFVGEILGNSPRERIWGTAASVAVGALMGARIIRVHDVKQMRQVVRVVDQIMNFQKIAG